MPMRMTAVPPNNSLCQYDTESCCNNQSYDGRSGHFIATPHFHQSMFLLFVLQYNFHPMKRKQHAHQCPIQRIDYTVFKIQSIKCVAWSKTRLHFRLNQMSNLERGSRKNQSLSSINVCVLFTTSWSTTIPPFVITVNVSIDETDYRIRNCPICSCINIFSFTFHDIIL